MTKMLDVLEAFLNLHGYSYLRLDGATGVDRRQKLMDRFNNDTKVSGRGSSGGSSSSSSSSSSNNCLISI